MYTMEDQKKTSTQGETTTRFGVKESNLRVEMEIPEKDRRIVRVDTLAVLKDMWGSNILMARDPLYTLVSCNTDDDEKYREILSSYYIRFYSFANYVDEKYLFEPADIPLITRIIKPAREAIDAYAESITDIMQKAGGQLLLHSHDFLFFYFKRNKIPRVEECTFI